MSGKDAPRPMTVSEYAINLRADVDQIMGRFDSPEATEALELVKNQILCRLQQHLQTLLTPGDIEHGYDRVAE